MLHLAGRHSTHGVQHLGKWRSSQSCRDSGRPSHQSPDPSAWEVEITSCFPGWGPRLISVDACSGDPVDPGQGHGCGQLLLCEKWSVGGPLILPTPCSGKPRVLWGTKSQEEQILRFLTVPVTLGSQHSPGICTDPSPDVCLSTPLCWLGAQGKSLFSLEKIRSDCCLWQLAERTPKTCGVSIHLGLLTSGL